MASLSERTLSMKTIDAPHFKFCPMCGHPMVIKCPSDDVHVREMCEGCGYIHYLNPSLLLELSRFAVTVFYFAGGL